jgi:hypothetical protein
MTDRDKYGGDTRRSLGATGFFRVEHRDRWWLVTPDGNAFLSLGLNHVAPGLLCRPYNIDFWREQIGPFQGAGDPTLLRWLEERAKSDLAAFGMNTLGCHSSTSPYSAPVAPYVHTLRFVDICHWQTPDEFDFLDVFAPEFEQHCDRLAAQDAAPRRDDPYLIGYSFTDCPVLTDLDAAERGVCVYGDARQALPTWPRVLRNLSAAAPGKQAYVGLVEEHHGGDIEHFNAAYDAEFESFDALAAATNWRPDVDPGNDAELRDNAAFLERVVERYYEVTTAAIRRHDPNHLILGDKLNGNTGVPDAIVSIVGSHVDVLFYQWYSHYDEQQTVLDRWRDLTGKPLFNGDSSFSVPDENMPVPLGPHCADQEQRAQAFTQYATSAFARPDFVGWNWCGWMDSWEVSQPGRQHSGVQTAFGEHYEPLRSAMAEFSAGMYDTVTE